MKKILVFYAIMVGFSCQKSRNLSISDVTGEWKSIEGATLAFEPGGDFSGISLPSILFSEYNNMKHSGSGKWKLEKKGDGYIIKLDFKMIDSKLASGNYFILISGSGVFENKPPWYLFLWKNEEGGERYKFAKS